MLPVSRIEWKPCVRIIPSRFPPIQLFERVARPEDLEAVFEIEAMTNTRLRDEVGDIQLVPPEERVSGPGSSVVMAPFTHLNPDGSRFSDGTYGVYYAANDVRTAVAETKHHRERFLAATGEGRKELDMRVYLADLNCKMHDLRGLQATHPLVYHKDSHSAGQHMGRELHRGGSNGVVYDSVRLTGGECVAVFRPHLLSNLRQERHLCYVWDGDRIEKVYEKREL